MANGKNGRGVQFGIGLSFSTGAILVLAALGTASAILIHKHKHKHMHGGMHGHGMHHAYFSRDDDFINKHATWDMTTPSPSGMVPGNTSAEICDMVYQNIHHRCKDKRQVERNVHTILGKIRGYEVLLRPLLQARMDARITEHMYQRKLRSIIDQISHELQLPMHKGKHIVKPDLINHDGSTDDTDMGGEGWYSVYNLPPDKHHWRTHYHMSLDESEPRIQDLAARHTFSAYTDLQATEDPQHIPLARANMTQYADDYANAMVVEIGDSYDYNTAPDFYLPPEQGIFK